MKLTKTASQKYKLIKVLFLILSIIVLLLSLSIWAFYILYPYFIDHISIIDTIFSKTFITLFTIGVIFISLTSSRYSHYKLLSTTSNTFIDVTDHALQVQKETFTVPELTGIYLNCFNEMNSISIVTTKKKIEIPYDAELVSNQTCLKTMKDWAQVRNVRFENNYVM